MNQIDFVGDLPSPPPFKDIGNTRPSTADQKAGLYYDLGRLCQKPPLSVINGDVTLTRRWVAAQKAGLALAKNSRATVTQLTTAIAQMRSFL